MTLPRTCLALVFLLPAVAAAEIAANDLPQGTLWYLHADLAAMRQSDGGSKLYARFEDEFGSEFAEETGIDISAELNGITAFAAAGAGTVVVLDGPLSQETRDKIMAFAATEMDLDARRHKGLDYYLFGDEDDLGGDGNEPLTDLEDASFVSFAIPGKALITGNEKQMQTLLESGGRISGNGAPSGALLVLSANRTLVQAGIDADEYEGDWESNIVRNTEQAALLVADASGQLALEAQLVSTEPSMATALASIVNGLIALQAFNDDLPDELKSMLRNTHVDVSDRTLRISTVVDPAALMSAID